MKALIQNIVLTLSLLCAPALFAGDGWLTSIEEGVKQAEKEGKNVLVEMTGSDWCPPCIHMNKEVFSKEKFVKAASKKYVLVVIDIPKADPDLYEKNSKVLGKYGVQGVPTVLILDKAGKEKERFTATQYPTLDKFLTHIGA